MLMAVVAFAAGALTGLVVVAFTFPYDPNH